MLAFVNAGHHYPFLIDAQGEVRDLVQGGPVLGLVEDSTYEQGAMPFRPDDLFVFYSDGITDRANPQGELFGVERLERRGGGLTERVWTALVGITVRP